MPSKNPENKTTVRHQLDHIAISVTDILESEQFYRDVLGLKQIPEPFKEGRHAWFDLGGAELHVIRASDKREEQELRNHLCLSVDDLESFINRLLSHDIDFFNSKKEKGKINVRPDGIHQIYFTDPDGHWIEINNAY